MDVRLVRGLRTILPVLAVMAASCASHRAGGSASEETPVPG